MTAHFVGRDTITETHRRSEMAESKSNRSQTSTGSQAVARRDEQEGSAVQRGESGISLRSPLAFMDRMTEEMDRMFDRVFRDFGVPRLAWMPRDLAGSSNRQALWAPRIEAFQQGDRFIVRADLPGLKREDIQLEVTGDALTIQGERREEQEQEREGYYRSERQYGRFYRSIPLPEGVITESAQATFRNGVLEVAMQAPPEEASRGRRLEIQEGAENSGNR